MTIPPPFREFVHLKENRIWHIRVNGAQVEVRFSTNDEELTDRVLKFRDSAEAEKEMEVLIADQLRDGFTETTPPAWQAFLNLLVDHWMTDDPAFDVKSLRSQVLTQAKPTARETIEAIARLADRYIIRADGARTLDDTYVLADRAKYWLESKLSVVLPAVLLALRHPDSGAQKRIDALLALAKNPTCLPALMSVFEHPVSDHTHKETGREQEFPVFALSALGPPSGPILERLVNLLSSSHVNVRMATAIVLGNHCADQAVFSAVWAVRDKAPGAPFALVRGAHARREASLRQYLESLLKRRAHERPPAKEIRSALEHLPGR